MQCHALHYRPVSRLGTISTAGLPHRSRPVVIRPLDLDQSRSSTGLTNLDDGRPTHHARRPRPGATHNHVENTRNVTDQRRSEVGDVIDQVVHGVLPVSRRQFRIGIDESGQGVDTRGSGNGAVGGETTFDARAESEQATIPVAIVVSAGPTADAAQFGRRHPRNDERPAENDGPSLIGDGGGGGSQKDGPVEAD